MKNKLFISMILTVLLILIVGCSDQIVDNTLEDSIEFEEEYMTFQDSIAASDVAIEGEYLEKIEHEHYVEYKFSVKKCLYGNITDDTIYLYSNIGSSYVESIDYSYILNDDVYEPGLNYILIMERYQSILYDHDRYMLATDLFLCEDLGEYTLYSDKIDIPSDKSIEEYICSIRETAGYEETEMTLPETAYENEIAQMVSESAYIGKVRILELFSEGLVHNGNTYRCSIETLYQGSDINTYEDGTILLTLLKNSVVIGEEYVIGFSPVEDDNSLIYQQTTADSVYENENIIPEIELYQSKK